MPRASKASREKLRENISKVFQQTLTSGGPKGNKIDFFISSKPDTSGNPETAKESQAL